MTNRNLSGYQFTHENAGDNLSGIHAYVKGQKRQGVVGQLYWNNNGMITSLAVHPEHQRKGLATEMHRRALKKQPELHHAPEEHRTLEGKQWINSRFGQDTSRNNPSSGYGYGAS